MAGTKTGGKQAAELNTSRYGSDYYSQIGKLGGSVKGIKKGFALMTPEQRAAAGRKGGKLSKRSYTDEQRQALQERLREYYERGKEIK